MTPTERSIRSQRRQRERQQQRQQQFEAALRELTERAAAGPVTSEELTQWIAKTHSILERA